MSMNRLDCIKKLKDYNTLKTAVLSSSSCAVFGIDEQKAYFTSVISEDTKRKLFIVVPDEKQARITSEIMQQTRGGCFTFPVREYNFRNIESVSRYDENKRIEAISHIMKGDFDTVVISAEALSSFIMPPEDYTEIVLRNGETTDFTALTEKISKMGYEFFSIVEGPGQYSVRGGIIDIFTPDSEAPYRIEFFGDDIDSISAFNINTQRRTETLDSIRIPQASEFHIEVAERLKRILPIVSDNKYVAADLDLLVNGVFPKHDRYLPLYYSRSANVLDYLPDNASVVFFDYRSCKESIEAFTRRLTEDMKTLVEDGFYLLNKEYFFTAEQIIAKISEPVIFETLPCSVNDFPIRAIANFSVFPTSVTSLENLKTDIIQRSEDGYHITVLTAEKQHSDELRAELGNIHGLTVDIGTLPYGFDMPEIKEAVFSYRQRTAMRKFKKTRYERGERIKSFADISQGDYIVHVDHGICVFDGIHKVESQGIINDYIKLKFSGTDILYIPCSQLDKISKYIGGNEDVKVKLSKLGGQEWEKSKARVKKSVRDLAKQLIALYGARLKVKGHMFPADSEWQRDFEAKFEFEETEDQLRCIEEVKSDMEKPVPMDRLLCGDVGFGKTEVAMRAVFKCVTDSKQAVILAPTTILAFQHYNTLTARFAGYPIKIGMLSRFVTPTQQTKTLKMLKSGELDIIVGTHRLLQKDVAFKDLGLIIIDEEQRFGVAHKEHLKELSKSADVLTLSATPIPRTLNMHMSGIRDISVLNEPPRNRYPVTTYVAEYDQGLVIDALKREVSRGGQCYYLHNRVDTIYKTAALIEEKTGFRVAVGHGKMSHEELSEIWEMLVKGEIDVLVCTTIIETGVDVPNCNTLIIDDADRLGLSQLHQIRGRVGRTDRRAYAYFTFRKGKVLSSDAYKRLMTIREYTEFGSGLKIAMRDLEIRGAGDILGAEQSGHLVTVGFDMYMRLLEQAVSEERGIEEKTVETTVEIKVNAYIPDKYIFDGQTRVEIYKLISAMLPEDETDVVDELIDRFGEPPEEVMRLIKISISRYLASKIGIIKIEQKDKKLLFYFDEQPSWDAVSAISAVYGRSILYSVAAKPYLTLKVDSVLDEMKIFLDKYSAIVDRLKNK